MHSDVIKIQKIYESHFLSVPKTIVEFGTCDLVHCFDFQTTYKEAKIYTFECHPMNIQICRDKLQQHGVCNITMVEKAILDYDGETDFYMIDFQRSPSKNEGSSSIFKINPEYFRAEPLISCQTPIKVPCTRFDTWALSNNIQNIDILNIDVQGAAKMALQGMGEMLKNTKMIAIELEIKSQYLDQPLFVESHKILMDNGFHLLKENVVRNNEWFGDFCYINSRLVDKMF